MRLTEEDELALVKQYRAGAAADVELGDNPTAQRQVTELAAQARAAADLLIEASVPLVKSLAKSYYA